MHHDIAALLREHGAVLRGSIDQGRKSTAAALIEVRF